MTDDERTKLQFDYAWKWFDFHAKQRTTMFNFYVVVLAATLGAVAALTKTSIDKTFLEALCGFGIFASLVFGLLDRRNQHLLRYGELNLVHLEKTQIFADDNSTVYYEGARRPLGILKQEYFRSAAGEGNQRGYYDTPMLLLSHRFLMPAFFVAVIIAFGFLLLALHLLWIVPKP